MQRSGAFCPWTRPGGMWCPLRPDAALRMTKGHRPPYRRHHQAAEGADYQDTFDKIAARYMDIAEEPHLGLDLGGPDAC